MARAKKSSKKGKKGNSVSLNLSDVETNGRVSDGEKLATVISVEQKESSGGNPYLNFKLKVKGGTVYHTCSLQPQALWNLRGVLEACGYEIPDDEFDLDLEGLAGAELGVTIENEEYRGKMKPQVIEVFSTDELSEEEGEEAEEDPEEEEEPEEEEVEEEEAEEEEVKPKKKGKKKAPKKKGKIKKGSKVSWDDDGETYEGKVTAIDDDIVTVEDADGDEWEMEVSDLN